MSKSHVAPIAFPTLRRATITLPRGQMQLQRVGGLQGQTSSSKLSSKVGFWKQHLTSHCEMLTNRIQVDVTFATSALGSQRYAPEAAGVLLNEMHHHVTCYREDFVSNDSW